jgi:hypothetical protein
MDKKKEAVPRGKLSSRPWAGLHGAIAPLREHGVRRLIEALMMRNSIHGKAARRRSRRPAWQVRNNARAIAAPNPAFPRGRGDAVSAAGHPMLRCYEPAPPALFWSVWAARAGHRWSVSDGKPGLLQVGVPDVREVVVHLALGVTVEVAGGLRLLAALRSSARDGARPLV